MGTEEPDKMLFSAKKCPYAGILMQEAGIRAFCF